MKSAFNRSILALAAILVVAGAGQAGAQQKPLKKYESGTKDFWTNPPPDWFLGDETEAQKGQAPPSGPPTGASEAELAAMMKKIKLPEGFSIEVYASNVLEARQMAWGDKGTLFVDARVAAEYAEKHIKGAASVPFKEQFPKVAKTGPEDKFDLAKLPADKAKPIVFYCNGSPCWKGYKAAEHAIKAGYKKVNWFRDGMPAWEGKGLPTE